MCVCLYRTDTYMTYWKSVCVPIEDRYLYDLLEVGVCVFRGQILI